MPAYVQPLVVHIALTDSAGLLSETAEPNSLVYTW